MTERVIVRPVRGLRLPMPGTSHLPEEDRFLPEEGVEMDRDLWVDRRLADGEVEVSEVPKRARRPRGRPEADGDGGAGAQHGTGEGSDAT